MDIELKKITDLNSKILERIDKFILSQRTNGEFINTIKYLSYHPKDRFLDESIVVLDKGSGEIKGVVMAVENPVNSSHLISHMGTTFSGPILDYKYSINENFKILDLILDHYESKFQKVEFRLRPTIYDFQPMEFIDYYFQKRNYEKGIMALANVIELSRIKNIDTQFQTYDSKRRNQVKKVLNASLFKFYEEDHIPKTFWENMNRNLKEKYGANTTHTYDEMQKLYSLCTPFIKVFCVKKITGAYGALGIIYKFKNVFHTQYLDMNYNLSSEYPNLFLIHKLIQIAREQRYGYFSFGASTEDKGQYLNEGLYKYKEGYGGGSIILPVYSKVCGN